jgi:hypothetical protein
VGSFPEITILQLPKFKAEATRLIGIELRWAAKGKGKRGGARVIYLYVVIAARRCCAKNVQIGLTADEKKDCGK